MRTIQREIVGAFIFSKDNKILLGKAGVFSDSWSVPGGGIEYGETLREALNREILEETGIDITNASIKELDEVNSASSEKVLRDTKERVNVDMNFHDYQVQLDVLSGDIELILDDDFTGAEWHATDSLDELNLAPGTSKRLLSLGYKI